MPSLIGQRYIPPIRPTVLPIPDRSTSSRHGLVESRVMQLVAHPMSAKGSHGDSSPRSGSISIGHQDIAEPASARMPNNCSLRRMVSPLQETTTSEAVRPKENRSGHPQP